MGMYCDKHKFHCSNMDSIVGMSTEDSILRSRTRGSKQSLQVILEELMLKNFTTRRLD